MHQIWSGKNSFKMIQNGSISPTGYLKAPQCFNGVSQWLKAPLYLILQANNSFYKQAAHFYSFLGQFLTSKCSKF